MADVDVQIGRNVARFRGDRSQKDVAAAMRERGWKWSQATVWSIEKGDRPLRLAEASALAHVFDVGIRGAQLFAEAESFAILQSYLAHIRMAVKQLEEAVESLDDARVSLAFAADSARPLDGLQLMSVKDWLEFTPEGVIRDLRLKHELDRDADEAQTDLNSKSSPGTARGDRETWRPEPGSFSEMLWKWDNDERSEEA